MSFLLLFPFHHGCSLFCRTISLQKMISSSSLEALWAIILSVQSSPCYIYARINHCLRVLGRGFLSWRREDVEMFWDRQWVALTAKHFSERHCEAFSQTPGAHGLAWKHLNMERIRWLPNLNTQNLEHVKLLHPFPDPKWCSKNSTRDPECIAGPSLVL